jgi:hypothetical protein
MGMVESHLPYVAPLCPAGHLPRTGGDHARYPVRRHVGRSSKTVARLISPLAGEMSGRTEGGVKDCVLVQGSGAQ